MKSAVVAIGGRQYLVKSGDVLRVEKQIGDVDSKINFDNVLLVSSGENVALGTPNVSGALVSATLIKQGRAKKIIVQKYKPKVRYRKKQGHRQLFTEIRIDEVKVA